MGGLDGFVFFFGLDDFGGGVIFEDGEEEVEEVEDGAGMGEDFVVFFELEGDGVGLFADDFFKFFGIGGMGLEENPGHFEVEEFLFNFGVD